ncbi:MAG: septum formation initiator family protein [Candidatus Magasanikbacteria bacterium]|nr:septum formation initiator family protein [Candidatus Magasanikbacteria bacterium]
MVIALVCVFLVAFGYARAYYQDYKIRQEIKALQDEVGLLEHKKLESMEILKYVTSDAFVEEKARTELNLKKPGESVLVVTNPEVETSPPMERDGEGEVSSLLSNPVKWWYYFTRHSVTETQQQNNTKTQ